MVEKTIYLHNSLPLFTKSTIYPKHKACVSCCSWDKHYWFTPMVPACGVAAQCAHRNTTSFYLVHQTAQLLPSLAPIKPAHSRRVTSSLGRCQGALEPIFTKLVLQKPSISKLYGLWYDPPPHPRSSRVSACMVITRRSAHEYGHKLYAGPIHYCQCTALIQHYRYFATVSGTQRAKFIIITLVFV